MLSEVNEVTGGGCVANNRTQITAKIRYFIVSSHSGHHLTEDITLAHGITSLPVSGRILL